MAISEESVEFDGDDVKWSDITEIRTRSLIEYLFTGGIDKQADKLPLPWFPGPRHADQCDLAGGVDAAARRRQATARGEPHSKSGYPPRTTWMEDADERAEQIKPMLAKLKP